MNGNKKLILEKVNKINDFTEKCGGANSMTNRQLKDVIVMYNELATMEFKYIMLLESSLDEYKE